MQVNNRISEDIIKIFHNSKGSVQNDIHKWISEKNNENTNYKRKKEYALHSPNTLHQNRHPEKPQYNYIHREKTAHFCKQETTCSHTSSESNID